MLADCHDPGPADLCAAPASSPTLPSPSISWKPRTRRVPFRAATAASSPGKKHCDLSTPQRPRSPTRSEQETRGKRLVRLRCEFIVPRSVACSGASCAARSLPFSWSLRLSACHPKSPDNYLVALYQKALRNHGTRLRPWIFSSGEVPRKQQRSRAEAFFVEERGASSTGGQLETRSFPQTGGQPGTKSLPQPGGQPGKRSLRRRGAQDIQALRSGASQGH